MVSYSGNLISQYRKSHFAPAFLFLKADRRKALQILYAVCRVLDDAVDKGHENPEKFLQAWRQVFLDRNLEGINEFGQKNLAEEFLLCVDKYEIPLAAMIDLIDKGVWLDLKKVEFNMPMDLESYFYGVAGTVGLACLPIFGVPWTEGKEFAIRLGIAIQTVNCIRDVGMDADMGRIYISADTLERYHVSRDSIFRKEETPEFKKMIQSQASSALSHFKRATELLPARWYRELLPARIMGKIYYKLLEKLGKKDFPVLHLRIQLNIWEKLSATISIIKERNV